jgi:hypothetical protein
MQPEAMGYTLMAQSTVILPAKNRNGGNHLVNQRYYNEFLPVWNTAPYWILHRGTITLYYSKYLLLFRSQY